LIPSYPFNSHLRPNLLIVLILLIFVQSSVPTTTLQALVNLKRPTLRLSPLTAVHEDSTAPHVTDLHHHGLEFEYDCDAPKCGIYVHVYLPKTHPDAPSTSSHHPLFKLLVFEAVVDGGFGNRLKLEEGALLELGRFENAHVPAIPLDASPSPVQVDAPPSSGDLASNLSSSEAISGRNRRRFSHFHFRKRSQNRSISGPALAVVDVEPVPAQEGKPVKDGKEDAEEGVKVTIRLSALNGQGAELLSPNEQITYLHIVRFGQKSAEVAEGGDPAEDTRPWVVKVVKREATVCFLASMCSLRDTSIFKKDRTPHFPPARDFRLDSLLGPQQRSSSHRFPTLCEPHVPPRRNSTATDPSRPSGRRGSSIGMSPLPVIATRSGAVTVSPSRGVQGLCVEHGRVRRRGKYNTAH